MNSPPEENLVKNTIKSLIKKFARWNSKFSRVRKEWKEKGKAGGGEEGAGVRRKTEVESLFEKKRYELRKASFTGEKRVRSKNVNNSRRIERSVKKCENQKKKKN